MFGITPSKVWTVVLVFGALAVANRIAVVRQLLGS